MIFDADFLVFFFVFEEADAVVVVVVVAAVVLLLPLSARFLGVRLALVAA